MQKSKEKFCTNIEIKKKLKNFEKTSKFNYHNFIFFFQPGDKRTIKPFEGKLLMDLCNTRLRVANLVTLDHLSPVIFIRIFTTKEDIYSPIY